MAKPAGKSTALWVARRLREAGFEAMFAGGCVRDMLLKIPSTDYDVATSAAPRQVRKLFRHVLMIGAKFGVAMVIHNGRKVEVTTFRSDLSYSDGRRPDGVRFASAVEDAMRRDFTINGMFYDPVARRVIDHVGGRADLAAKVVRTIGPAQERFGEDYLRMIRAVRFTVRFGFQLDRATAAAVRQYAANITAISGERIFDELSKMLSLPSAVRAMKLLEQLSLAQVILPEMFVHQDTWPTAIRHAGRVARYKDATATVAAMLAALPAGQIAPIVRRWGAANLLRDAACYFSQHMDGWQDAASMPLCRFKRLMANRNFANLRRLWAAEERFAGGTMTFQRRLARRIRSIPAGRIAPPPLVTGGDLQKMGLPAGPGLGRALRKLYDAQLNEEVTTRKQAVAMAKRMLAKSAGRRKSGD